MGEDSFNPGLMNKFICQFVTTSATGIPMTGEVEIILFTLQSLSL